MAARPTRRFLSPALRIALAAGCLACSSAGSRLSELQIERALEEMDRAAVAGDTAALMDYIAQDAVIRITTMTDTGPRTQTLSPADLRSMLEQGFAVAEERRYERLRSDITLAEDASRAWVESEIAESIRVGGQTLRSLTEERATFEARREGVVVTSLAAVSQMR